MAAKLMLAILGVACLFQAATALLWFNNVFQDRMKVMKVFDNGIKNVHVEKGLYNCRDFTSSKIKDAIYYLDLYMEKNNDAGIKMTKMLPTLTTFAGDGKGSVCYYRSPIYPKAQVLPNDPNIKIQEVAAYDATTIATSPWKTTFKWELKSLDKKMAAENVKKPGTKTVMIQTANREAIVGYRA